MKWIQTGADWGYWTPEDRAVETTQPAQIDNLPLGVSPSWCPRWKAVFDYNPEPVVIWPIPRLPK